MASQKQQWSVDKLGRCYGKKGSSNLMSQWFYLVWRCLFSYVLDHMQVHLGEIMTIDSWIYYMVACLQLHHYSEFLLSNEQGVLLEVVRQF